MVTVTAETSWSSTVDDAWAALGRRDAYLGFPGIAPRGRRGGRTFDHALDLPIVDPQHQASTLTIGRAGVQGRRERRFALSGELVRISGLWRLEPIDAGVRVQLSLEYDIAAPLKTLAVDTLRSRSPLPIRTDADAILSRAVDEFFETRFAEQAAAYCERLRVALDARAAWTRRA